MQKEMIQKRGTLGKPLRKSHSVSRNWLSPEQRQLNLMHKGDSDPSGKWVGSNKSIKVRELKSIKEGEEHALNYHNPHAE